MPFQIQNERRYTTDYERWFHRLTNTKVFLSNIGIQHWGSRGDLEGYEAHDVSYRAAHLFGYWFVKNCYWHCSTGVGVADVQPRLPDGGKMSQRRQTSGQEVAFQWQVTGPPPRAHSLFTQYVYAQLKNVRLR